MLKPSNLSLALVIMLCSCTKSDDAATSKTAAPAVQALQSAIQPTESDSVAAPMPASAPQQSAEKAATKAEPEGSAKPKPQVADKRANRKPSLTVPRWDKFQAAMQRCVSVPLGAREQCLAEARDAYRAANLHCAELPGRASKECVKYAKLWEDTDTDVPIAAVSNDEEPAAIPSAPIDAGSAERNGDGTKQQRESAGTEPERPQPDK